MKVSELGEFGLIELLADIVNKSKNPQDASWRQLLIGIGDDAAAWRGDSSTQLATTDSLVQDTHFNLNIIGWEDLGYKALAVNLSDIAAMGGIPKYALASLSLPGETEAECVSSLYQGMIQLAQEFGIAIIGGNIASGPNVVITITVLGSLKGDSILSRSAAIAGEQIAVTGYLGMSAAGLEMLKQQLKLDDRISPLLRQAHLHPIPKVKEGQTLLHLGVRAAIDISDGLIADLSKICQMSKVSANINLDYLPIHPMVKASFKTEYLEMALSGGEDYELLFTASSQVMERVKRALSCRVTVIGEVTEQKAQHIILTDATGSVVTPGKKGWEHFKSRD